MGTTSDALELEALHPEFGVRVRGVDLKGPIAEGTRRALMQAFDEHSLLVFPAQHLDTGEQVRFSALFGPLEEAITRKADSGPGLHVAHLSNVGADGAIVPPHDRRQLFHTANRLWHTDSTFKPQTALASLLSAEQVPASGGETEFVSTRAAFEALPAPRRRALEGLWAVHDFQRSRDLVAPGLIERDVQEMLPPVARPLVRSNPRNGRAALYIASHAVSIEGMTPDEGRALLDDLIAWCTRPERVYTHRWAAGDLVMWDNRATMHRGRPFDARVERRVMARTTVIDTLYDDEPEVRARAA